MGFSTRTLSYLNDSDDLAVLSLVSQVPGFKSCRQSGVNFQIRGSTEPAQLQLYVNATAGFGWDFSVVYVPDTRLIRIRIENRDKPARARRARASMQEKIYENLRNPARARRAGAMRWFPTNIGIHQKRHKYTT